MRLPSSSKRVQSTAGLAAFALSFVLGGLVPAIGTPPPAAAQVSCTPVSTANLAGHWKFDENTGTTTADSSGNGHTGTLQNGPVWSSGTTLVTPNPSALRFDGTNDQVTVANSGNLAFGTGSFTVSLFAKTGTGNRGVLGNFNGTNRGWGLYFYPTQVNFFGYGTLGTNDVPKTAATLLNDQWHHVAGIFTHSGNTLKIDSYIDGTLVGTNTATVGNIASASALLFGRYLGQPNYDGSLDDIRVYGRTLSAAEIASLAAGCGNAGSSSSSSSVSSSTGSSLSSTSSASSACTPLALTGLSALWKFDEASGTVVNDSTTFNNSGSLVNGVTRTASGAPVNFSNPGALSFDGVNDHVLVPNTFNLPSGSMARTVALWMRPDMITNQAALVSLGNGSASGQKFIVMMGTSAGSTYAFTDGVNAANNVTLTGSQIPTTNAWHHVAFSMNGSGSWQYYLDGTLKKSGTFPVAINTNTNDVEIGSRHDVATGHFDGRLDDVRLYNKVLSASEIASLAAGCGNAGSSSSSSSVSSSTGSSLSSTSSSSSSSSSAFAVPTCDGQTATIYVRNNKIVGGTNSGATFGGALYGTSGNDVIVGTAGNDFIRGNQGNDLICGRAGNDFIIGDQGNDTIRGGDGTDLIFGEEGSDSLFGNQGTDRLYGGNGTDVLCGQAQNDFMQGQNGSDQLDGGAGFDNLYGGSGNNTCANGESNSGCNQNVNNIPACSNNNQ
jgi:Ca2+-binding RTX toxin-like protein